MKKCKRYSFLLVFTMCLISAFSFLKSSAVSSQKNEVRTNPNTEYQITYELNGGRFEGEYPKTFKISQETAIPNPIKDGSEFLGWTINDVSNLAPIKDYKIPAMTQMDIKLTANWKSSGNILVNGQTFNSKINAMPKFKNVEEIRFIKGIPNPNGVDVSEAQDKSIMAYISGVTLTVACEDEIMANPNCSRMFYEFGDIFSNTNKVLNKITFKNFNTSQVTDMSFMFCDCNKLTSLDVSNFDTSNVININLMFTNCLSLKTLDVSNFDTSNVLYMGDVFYQARELTSINVSGWDTSKAVTMARMFMHCYELREVIGLDKWDTTKVNVPDSMFYNCYKLSGSIAIMNPSIESQYYADVFKNCSTDPSAMFIVRYISPETKNIARRIVNTKSSNSNVFLSEEPKTLVDGGTFNSRIKSLSNFGNVTKVVFNYGIPSNISNYTNTNVSTNGDIRAYINGDTLHIVSNGDIRANPDSSNLFRYCYNLSSIDFTNNFKTDDVTQMNSMFETDNKLTEIKGLENFNTSSVMNMSAMFSNCSSLTSLNLNKWNTSSVTDMSGMFFACNNLKSAKISKLDISKVTNTSSMFNGCKKLNEEITINNTNTNSYNDMFRECSTDLSAKFIVKYTDEATKQKATEMVSTKSKNSNVFLYTEASTLIDGLTFNSNIESMPNFANVEEIRFVYGTPNPSGEDVSEAQDGSIMAYIEGTVLTVASEGEIYANTDSSYMFREYGISYGSNRILNKITFENFNTSQVMDMAGMFSGCGSLTNLDVSKWNTSKVTNMTSMFNGCNVLSNLDLSNFNISKVTNMDKMFYECYKLNSEIKISNPNKTSYIDMFAECSTDPSAKFIVKYISSCKDIAQAMVDTKSLNSNVYLYGELKNLLTDGETFNSIIKAMPNFANVTEIKFVKGTPNPNGVDVTESQNGSIKAYIEGNILTVACEDKIYANPTSKRMFYEFGDNNGVNRVLNKITFDNFDTSKVVVMEAMFSDCESLQSLDLSPLDTSKVTDMNMMFGYCDSLGEIQGIGNINTSQVINMDFMFYGCTSLINLNLNNWDTSRLRSTYYMLNYCINLSGEITIMNPNMLSNDYKYMFGDCSKNSGRFVVNYISGCRDIAQGMVNTKENGNVILGSQKSLLNEDIPNNEEPSVPDTVMLTIKDGNKSTMKEILTGEIGSLNIPSKEGMVFSGYFYDIEYTKPVSERDVISEDTTIYIKWEEVPQEETSQEEEVPQNEEILQEENKDESFEVA